MHHLIFKQYLTHHEFQREISHHTLTRLSEKFTRQIWNHMSHVKPFPTLNSITGVIGLLNKSMPTSKQPHAHLPPPPHPTLTLLVIS